MNGRPNALVMNCLLQSGLMDCQSNCWLPMNGRPNALVMNCLLQSGLLDGQPNCWLPMNGLPNGLLNAFVMSCLPNGW